MSTFYGTYGSAAMFAAVSQNIDKAVPDHVDVHTITLTLSGYHGEFDLVVEGTDMRDNRNCDQYRWEGVAHRSGGVAGFHKVRQS
jgi:hypothetical protein